MPLESIETRVDTDLAATQWQARVDLAAAHRLCVKEGFHEGIFNHLTLRVPGRNDRYYQIPFGLHWAEVTASCLMESAMTAPCSPAKAMSKPPRSASTRRSTGWCRMPRRCSTRISRMPARWHGWRIRASCRSARPNSA